MPPRPLLVLEGVGSGRPRVADLVTVLVWVEAPHDVRLARGLERDGDDVAPHWDSGRPRRPTTSPARDPRAGGPRLLRA